MANNIDKGIIYFIGAGPGDPELLTLKAARIISQAQVVMYDRLVSPETLALAPSWAQMVPVGKQCGRASKPQSEINDELAQYALQGKSVVRLKGGDVALFSNVLDELETAVKHNIPYEIVPGITAASGASAYLGIPLTAREHAASVRFITLHGKEKDKDLKLRTDETVALYMSSFQWSEISATLIKAGLAPSTPTVFVAQATTPNQRHVFTTLGSNNDVTFLWEQPSPILIIVGNVVEFGKKFGWFAPQKTGTYFTEIQYT